MCKCVSMFVSFDSVSVWLLMLCFLAVLWYRSQTQRVCVDVRQRSFGPQANSQTLKKKNNNQKEKVKGYKATVNKDKILLKKKKSVTTLQI